MVHRPAARAAAVIALSLTIALPLHAHAQAQPGKRGRLPDGRAYRYDEQGFRLADHVAELEVTVDDLRRQVAVLEGELDEKEQRLKAIGAGYQPQPVKERTLVREQQQPASCTDTVALLNAKISTLEAQLRDQSQRLAPPPQACDYSSSKNPLAAEVTRLRQILAAAPAADTLDKERAASVAARNELDKEHAASEAIRGELAVLRAGAEGKDRQIAELQVKLRQMEYASTDAQRRFRELASAAGADAAHAADRGNDKRASLSAPLKQDLAPSGPATSEKMQQTSDEVRALKSEFRAVLVRVDELINERKNLVDAMKARKRGVSVQVQRLASQDGRSLDNLRSEVQTFDAKTDASGVRKGLNDVESKLEEDVALLKRLSG